MKFALIFGLMLSTSAFARQYIQCSTTGDSTDVMVVNLQDEGKQSTLFLSSGMQNPEDERLLVNIDFDKVDGLHTIFKVVGEVGSGSVAVPTEVLGKYSNFFIVELNFADYSYPYSCFSAIYNE
jgi:hypothetical protein